VGAVLLLVLSHWLQVLLQVLVQV
jgi:hypothetical protein